MVTPILFLALTKICYSREVMKRAKKKKKKKNKDFVLAVTFLRKL